MIADVMTIAWKEWKEQFARQGRFGGGWTNFALTLGVFGVVMPAQFGARWADSPAMLLAWLWAPLLMSSTIVVDAIAGERERHTLETLLASRIPDAAIVCGKIATAIGYALLVTLGSLALGLVTMNVVARGGTPFSYRWTTVAGAVVVTLLGTTMVGGLGVLVSLRSATVRQAGQLMATAVLVLGFAPFAAMRILAAWLGGWERAIASHAALVVSAGLALVIGLDVGVMVLTLAAFRRSRLVLD